MNKPKPNTAHEIREKASTDENQNENAHENILDVRIQWRSLSV